MQNENRSEVNFGPSPYFTLGAFIGSPLTWLGVVAFIICHSILVRSALWRGAESVGLGEQMLTVLRWIVQRRIPLHYILFIFGLLHGYIRYMTTEYRIAENGDLVISSGLLSFFGPRGPFVVFEDGIAGRLVTDVNVTRNPVQMLFGTGTLVLTYIELIGSKRIGRVKHVPFVPSVERNAALIRERSGVQGARFWM